MGEVKMIKGKFSKIRVDQKAARLARLEIYSAIYPGDNKSFDQILDETMSRQDNLSLKGNSNDLESESLFKSLNASGSVKNATVTLKSLFEYAVEGRGFLENSKELRGIVSGPMMEARFNIDLTKISSGQSDAESSRGALPDWFLRE